MAGLLDAIGGAANLLNALNPMGGGQLVGQAIAEGLLRQTATTQQPQYQPGTVGALGTGTANPMAGAWMNAAGATGWADPLNFNANPARIATQDVFDMPAGLALGALQALGGVTDITNPFVERIAETVVPGLLLYYQAISNDPAGAAPYVMDYIRALSGPVSGMGAAIQYPEFASAFQQVFSSPAMAESLKQMSPSQAIGVLRDIIQALGYTALTPAAQMALLGRLNQALANWQAQYLYSPQVTPADLIAFLQASNLLQGLV